MFNNGSQWLRFDCHLHTKADKEFKYSDEENQFVSDYISKLKEENIGVGIITNHNKFDVNEFIALEKKAKKEGIIIYPGVELSVKEGANGIHCLIAFDRRQWIENRQKESINSFLDEVFKGIDNRENENTRCNKDLFGVIEALNEYDKEYFVILAHVEQKSGFFKECDGGLIKSLSCKPQFSDRVLAFQKVRTRDTLAKVENWMGYSIAHVEGSDCKSIKEIGKGKSSYIKIGDASFKSLVVALKDFGHRISKNREETKYGYIHSIKFEGGILDGQEIDLSSGLNTLVGIRGSGKSSILESIRYVLGLELSDNDKVYKQDLLDYVIGSGGKITITAYDKFNKKYEITRILNENTHVYQDGEVSGAKPSSIILNPLYFGQKDLSTTQTGFELRLLDKVIGKDNSDIENKLESISKDFQNKFNELVSIENDIEKREELKTNLRDVKHNLKIFDDNQISNKLEKQLSFKKDSEILSNRLSEINAGRGKIGKTLNDYVQHFDDLDNISPDTKKYFEIVNGHFKSIKEKTDSINKLLSEIDQITNKIRNEESEFHSFVSSFDEEFANIRRSLKLGTLRADDYIGFKKRESELNDKLKKIDEKEGNLSGIKLELKSLSSKRNELLRKEFNSYLSEIDRINNSQDFLNMSAVFKGNKEIFVQSLKKYLKGSGVTNLEYENIAKTFTDWYDLILDRINNYEKLQTINLSASKMKSIDEKISNQYSESVQQTVDHKIEITYHNKPLGKLSLGQRSSALVLFILSQAKNDLIIIDQPEDDLDNKVIYEEVIKTLRNQKGRAQFIFATHNANIPVLGDSEQVLAMDYDESSISIVSGSIDNPDIQEKIVEIMEGGKEAFERRTEIYNLWK